MAKKKMSRPEVIQALKDAVEHVRENGREGRTIPDIAGQFGVKPHSLRCKLSEAGLTSSVDIRAGQSADAESVDGQTIPVQDAINPDGLLNSLPDSDICQLSSKLVENRGNEGVTTPLMSGVHRSGVSHAESAYIGPSISSSNSSISETDAAILEVKAEVVREYKRLLREARRQIEVKNVRDYKAVADHLLELLGDSKGGKSVPLIQVTILGDSGNREPRLIRSINESGNESGAIEAESVTV